MSPWALSRPVAEQDIAGGALAIRVREVERTQDEEDNRSTSNIVTLGRRQIPSAPFIYTYSFFPGSSPPISTSVRGVTSAVNSLNVPEVLARHNDQLISRAKPLAPINEDSVEGLWRLSSNYGDDVTSNSGIRASIIPSTSYMVESPLDATAPQWPISTPRSTETSVAHTTTPELRLDIHKERRQSTMDSSTTLVTSPSSVISPNKKGKLARSATIDEEEMHTGFDWEISPPGKTLASLSTSGSSESLKPKPMVPNASSRYDRRESPKSDNIPIPAGPPSMNRGSNRARPEGWEMHVHPEGQPYFVRPRTEVYDIPVVTEANICDDVVKIRVVDLAQRLMDQFNSEGWHFKDPDVELFVTVSDDENDSGSYYFLHHGENVIFWLEKVTEEDIGDPLIASFSGSDHLRLHLHYFYWVHQEYFPHHLVAETFVSELIGVLGFNTVDKITCPTSTSSYDQKQLNAILKTVKYLKYSRGPARTAVVGRVWAEIYRARFINYHGELGARLFRTQFEVIEWKSRHPIMKLVFLVLFDAPSIHLTALCDLYAGKVLYAEGWRKCMDHLCKNWQDMILQATVLLTGCYIFFSANMSFLAIFNSTEQVIQENHAVTCSMVSTLLSTSSIVTGLLLVRKHREFIRLHAEEADAFLKSVSQTRLGLQPLAILYSLPYALLMWAMVSFIAAILLYAFQSGIGIASRIIISSLALALMAVLVWIIRSFWKDDFWLIDALILRHPVERPGSPSYLSSLFTPDGFPLKFNDAQCLYRSANIRNIIFKDNTLEVNIKLNTDKNYTDESGQLFIREDSQRNEIRRMPRRKAVLIAISYKGQKGEDGQDFELPAPLIDLEEIKRFIMKHQYTEENIVILADDGKLGHIPPTHDNIVNKLEDLVAGATAEDRYFVWYSGHGCQVINDKGKESDGRDECIMPCDWRYVEGTQRMSRDRYKNVILDDTLWKILVSSLPLEAQLIALFDCCNAGTMLDLPYNWPITPGLDKKPWRVPIRRPRRANSAGPGYLNLPYAKVGRPPRRQETCIHEAHIDFAKPFLAHVARLSHYFLADSMINSSLSLGLNIFFVRWTIIVAEHGWLLNDKEFYQNPNGPAVPKLREFAWESDVCAFNQ
ncbi:caspase domain-containing protein [Hysterangium stoloniferum]|nr:caspase domain-containing protein [Hysterangium stoloniferum]